MEQPVSGGGTRGEGEGHKKGEESSAAVQSSGFNWRLLYGQIPGPPTVPERAR